MPVPSIADKLRELQKANGTETIFIRPTGSKALSKFTNELVDKAFEKTSQAQTKFKEPSFAKFQSAVDLARSYIRDTSGQHPVLQFFTEDDIRKQLDMIHTKLGESYKSLTSDSPAEAYKKLAQDAEKEDCAAIKEYMEAFRMDGDVTRIARILSCEDPSRDDSAMSVLRMVGRKNVGPASLLPDFIKWIDRDWFWLTFTSKSRQEIKAPLTRVLPDVIPVIKDRLASDDVIALTSDDWRALDKVNRLFSILDNSNNLALVESFRSALANTELRDKLRTLSESVS